MSSRKNLQDASGSFLGYLFQIERAIFWLSSLSSDEVLGIEVEDDISIKLSEGVDIKEIYEQAKHSNTQTIPYSDKSIDLWKTLSIWVAAVLEKRIDINKAKFSILSNKPILKTRLIYKIHLASKIEELKDCCEKTKKIALTLRKELKRYGDIVLSCPDDLLIDLFSRVEILDNEYRHESSAFSALIKKNLHMHNGLPVDHIIDMLFGSVSRQLIDKWRNHQEAWLSADLFNQNYAQIIADYTKKSYLEATVDLLPPISSKDIDKNKSNNYVEQLTLIECKEDEILEAIHDYIRATSEKARFAKDGEISVDKFDEFYQDLRDNWQNISRPKFRFVRPEELTKVGYEIFYETIRYKGKLNQYEPIQAYTHKGAYHHLANELLIGWHPQWDSLLKK